MRASAATARPASRAVPIGLLVVSVWMLVAIFLPEADEVTRTFTPIVLTILASLAIFGPWPLQVRALAAATWNTSLWPASIPVGLILLGTTAYRRMMSYAIGAAPFLSPYLALQSWVGVLFAPLPSPLTTVAAVIGLWLLVLFQVGG